MKRSFYNIKNMKSFNYLLILFISIYPNLSLLEKESFHNNIHQNLSLVDLDDFNIAIEESKCKKVVDTLIYMLEEIYIFNDIAKNPPNNEYYGSIDLIKELKKIETKDRKYYDFYRDIKRTIAKLKDMHFLFSASKCIENGSCINQLSMCLPISLIIKGNSSENAKVYIQKNEDCIEFYDNTTINFINKNLENPLKTINGTDVFNFIQNFGTEFANVKGEHGRFSYYLENLHSFQVIMFPFTKNETSNIKFVFNDNQNITLDYHLLDIGQKLQISKEFREFYNKELYEQNNNMADFSLFNIYRNFVDLKNNKNEIEWKYSTKNPSGFQCLIDNKNEVNVFKQESFQLYDDLEETVNKCTEEFYNNAYPIIGIESRNIGGNVIASEIVRQMIQVKILQRVHESIKYSDYIKNNINKLGIELFDIETCEKIKDFKEIIDEYGKEIKHHRTQVTQRINSSILKKMKERRKKYYEYNHLKKPTEILIFTDFFSFSTTSYFIKGLQETGGAIIVGYKGNPKSNENLDASLSPSGNILTLSGTDINKNFTECEFQITVLTFRESFNYSYQAPNPTPREYLLNPVDERVHIYQRYNDTLYDDFIKEAKKIFKKYNEDQKCNPDNLLLTYEPDNKECYSFQEIPHAHGGYECNKETQKWSNICRPYYCDIGYYFDTYQNKCIEDICTEGNEKDNDNFSKFPNMSLFGMIFLFIIFI